MLSAAVLLLVGFIATDAGVSVAALPLSADDSAIETPAPEETPQPDEEDETGAEDSDGSDPSEDAEDPPIDGGEPVDGGEESEPVEKAESEAPGEPLESKQIDAPDTALSGIGAVFSAGRPSTGFKAGYIISDANFYNGTAMSAAQIQQFLNQRVPKPTAQSLRNYKETTTKKAADKYCAAYAGRSGETAAQIIAKVSKACGISPQVVLVMLQKEQSLVSVTSPSKQNYDRAMGYACPDTGKGGSANCDKAYYGFFNQVWHGTKRLKRYGMDTATFNWFPLGKPLNIGYNVAAKNCGTKRVTIENKATAALYYYTPYTPNAAAIRYKDGLGAADKCSTYGNINFFILYKSWFGMPNTSFPDVPQTSQFYTEIEWMASKGLANGTVPKAGGAARFNRMDGTTRRAMAAFLYRASGSPSVKLPAQSPFSDVKRGDSFYKEIVWMHQEGLAKGYKKAGSKPEYRPMSQVNRGSMAAFLFRLDSGSSGYKAPATSPFRDVPKSHQFYREISWMRSTGLANGYKHSSGARDYRTGSKVTRQAMAAFLYRYDKL